MKNFALTLVALLVFSLSAFSQVTLNVPTASYPTIQSAINASAAGDTVQVTAGVFYENLTWPTHGMVLKGAGPGQTIIDAGYLAPCIQVINHYHTSSLIDGVTLRRGQGLVHVTPTGNYTLGGAIYSSNFVNGSAPSMINCEITKCVASSAAVMYGRKVGDVTFDSVHIHHNNMVSNPVANAVGTFWLDSWASATVLFRGCTFEGHGNDIGGAAASRLVYIQRNPIVTFEDCQFLNNSFPGVNSSLLYLVFVQQCTLRRCAFIQNEFAHGLQTSTANTLVSDCLVARNKFVAQGFHAPGGTLRHCTFAHNSNFVLSGIGGAPPIVDGFSCIDNSVFWGNTDHLGSVAPANHNLSAFNTTVSYCNMEGTGGYGLGGIDADPLFQSPAGFDFRLLPGSPCINYGSLGLPGGFASFDLRGFARVRQGATDLGCFEAQQMAHHSLAGGTVGATLAGPYDVLLVNGSGGGAVRTVRIPINGVFTLSMIQPPVTLGPAKFVIFGYLGRADLDTVTSVPFGIGDMMFAPLPLVPLALQSQFFTFTDNFNPATIQLVPSTLTPWIPGFSTPIPFPLTMTLQGVIEEAPGVFSSTNAIIVKIE